MCTTEFKAQGYKTSWEKRIKLAEKKLPGRVVIVSNAGWDIGDINETQETPRIMRVRRVLGNTKGSDLMKFFHGIIALTGESLLPKSRFPTIAWIQPHTQIAIIDNL